MPSRNTYHLTWVSLTLDVGISSRLLQQSEATAPYLGRRVSSHGHPSWPWTWSRSSQPSCARAAAAPWRRELPKNFQMFKLVLEKAEEQEIKFPISVGSSKKQESSRKTSISALLTMPKPSTVWIIINCGKFWRRWEYQTTWPASWETCMQVRKQQLGLDMEQQTGSK